jgi:hypothetical protein
MVQAAEHNKRICEALKRRVYAVDLAVLDFKVHRDKGVIYNETSYSCLQNLITIMTQIKKFISNISQMKTLLKSKYIQQKNIENFFKEICKDFDNCVINIDIPYFTAIIKNKIRPEEEIDALEADQEELNEVSF